MPIHDWTRVEPGIFHHFRHAWIEEITRYLNAGALPADYYAMAEQFAGGLGPDVLTLQETDPGNEQGIPGAGSDDGNVLLMEPKLQVTAETDLAYYRRKQATVAIRHVSEDRIVAMIEVLSPGNKNSRHAVRAFVDKVAELLDHGVHLLLLDVHPPGPRDPDGIHGLVWDEIAGKEYSLPGHGRLTFVAYESSASIRAFVVHAAVGEAVPEMPLILGARKSIALPLETIYQSAFAVMPRRWRVVLEA